ncbi:MAG: hypothetical protein ACYDEC_03350 [Bacteroidia bacterium]
MKKVIVYVFLVLIFSCTKKNQYGQTTSNGKIKTGSVVFWSDDPSPNRVIYVSIDGILQVGNISNYQTVAPSSCVQSNTLFMVSTTQALHYISFTDNISSWSASSQINLYSDCYICYAPHR